MAFPLIAVASRVQQQGRGRSLPATRECRLRDSRLWGSTAPLRLVSMERPGHGTGPAYFLLFPPTPRRLIGPRAPAAPWPRDKAGAWAWAWLAQRPRRGWGVRGACGWSAGTLALALCSASAANSPPARPPLRPSSSVTQLQQSRSPLATSHCCDLDDGGDEDPTIRRTSFRPGSSLLVQLSQSPLTARRSRPVHPRRSSPRQARGASSPDRPRRTAVFSVSVHCGRPARPPPWLRLRPMSSVFTTASARRLARAPLV
jgi:hypothetical protein